MHIPSRLRILLATPQAYLLLKRNQPPHQYLMTPLVVELAAGDTPASAIQAHLSTLGLSANDAAVPQLMGTVHLTCTDGRTWATSYFVCWSEAAAPLPDHPQGTLEWLLAENVPNVPMPHLDWIAIKTHRKATPDAPPFEWTATLDPDERLLQLSDSSTDTLLYQRRQQ